MTIQIPDDLAQSLENIAAAQHKSVEQVALESLRSLCRPPLSPQELLRRLREIPPPSREAMEEFEAALADERKSRGDKGIFDDAPER